MAEVGFNAGHSAAVWLSANPQVRVVSFDLGEHPYTSLAKCRLDRRFPGRHELVNGRSQSTVPEYRLAHPDRKFGLVFIDGAHGFSDAWEDLVNLRSLSSSGGYVIMDDTVNGMPWGDGPNRAWDRAVTEGLVVHIRRFYYNNLSGRERHAFSVGRYA